MRTHVGLWETFTERTTCALDGCFWSFVVEGGGEGSVHIHIK